MHLHKLETPPGSHKKPKRKGRGPGSTLGKTAGRGQKGQYARSPVKPGFEGGQTPLRRRLPRRGFKNYFKAAFEVVNVGALSIRPSAAKITEFDPDVMRANGLVRRSQLPVKVLGDGEVTRAITVKAHKFSKSAVDKIQAAGGKAVVIEG
jgi:large subunit ribosomal protein L15